MHITLQVLGLLAEQLLGFLVLLIFLILLILFVLLVLCSDLRTPVCQ